MDIVCLVVLGITEMLFHVIPINPSHRGFFCGDTSLQKPFQKETVSTLLTIAVGFLVSILVIIVCEAVNAKSKKKKLDLKKITIKCGPLTLKPSPWQRRTLFLLFMFGFGALITNLFTDMGKVTVGRLRPYFLTICKPNATLLNCSQGYVMEDICTGDPKEVLEARTSFPSAHASFSAYSMVFLVLYLESSMPTKRSNLVKPFVQVAFLSLGLLCALSRIFDYWHHWGDVLVGLFLGTIVAFFITFRSLRLFSIPHCPKCHPIDETDIVRGNAMTQSEEETGLNDTVIPLG
ncbi:hypothetical protein OS493_008737 [Desmophyllum pertusum]|uniref:Phosphatidic acid phosphatase type 2/haloperoxidase domain-containing protein n=1 Tax=Desmophyllum pertusum TaxID=174260 RepID=A0A9W9ZV92_9CNID|nr:hypothetical protein OS493_008737 [Desmophyllum pertusum]